MVLHGRGAWDFQAVLYPGMVSDQDPLLSSTPQGLEPLFCLFGLWAPPLTPLRQGVWSRRPAPSFIHLSIPVFPCILHLALIRSCTPSPLPPSFIPVYSHSRSLSSVTIQVVPFTQCLP